jgi:hypothetical protein
MGPDVRRDERSQLGVGFRFSSPVAKTTGEVARPAEGVTEGAANARANPRPLHHPLFGGRSPLYEVVCVKVLVGGPRWGMIWGEPADWAVVCCEAGGLA